MNKEEKLIYIEWADCVSSGAGWIEKENLNEWIDDVDWIVKQCGFLIKETPKYILLAGHIKPEDGFTGIQYGHLQKIPKTWIRKRINLTPYK